MESTSKTLFNQVRFSDVQLLLIELEADKRQTIYAHKAILANVSPFFESLFEKEFKEKQQTIIEVYVPSIMIALALIEWIYVRNPYIPPQAESLAQAWLIIETPKIPYPGLRSKFALSDEWEIKDSDAILRHRIIYTSSNSGHINRFELRRYRDKSLEIYYSFPKEYNQVLKTYFQQFGIVHQKLDCFLPNGHNTVYADRSANAFKHLIKIILQNNDFQPGDVKKINEFLGYKLHC